MRITKPGMYEYEVEGVLYHAFRAQGAERVGYGFIVASGGNACVLHYVENSRQMADRDLLLIDAGAEYDYYTADITRVFPVGGKFTQEQRDVYGAVLKAQKECIAKSKPGTTLAAIHAHAVEVLTEELKRLKVLKGPTARLIKNMEYRAYDHGTGHGWNGRARRRPLLSGKIFQLPNAAAGHGLYDPALDFYFGKDSAAPEKYKGIGVRIEDDILVTAGGCKVLTSGVPKEIDEVESMCSQP